MKEIKAVVQPFKLTKIRNALRQIQDFPGMSITKAEGFGHLHDDASAHTVKAELTDFSPKIRLEIIAPDDRVDEIVRVLMDVAHTGQKGDGLIWITPIEHAIKISRLTEI